MENQQAFEEKMNLIGQELTGLFERAGVKCAFASFEFENSGIIVEHDFKCSPSTKAGLIYFAQKNIDKRVDGMIAANLHAQAQKAMSEKGVKLIK